MFEQEYKDPSGNTEQFRAFVQSTDSDAGNDSRPVGLITGIAVAVVVVLVVIVWLAAS